MAKCEIRTFRPRSSSGYACMHVKCWVIDEKLVLSGSSNLTHNGLEKNKEHLYRITEPVFVSDVLADFETTWTESQPVGQQEIDLMMATYQENLDKKQENKDRKAEGRDPSPEVNTQD